MKSKIFGTIDPIDYRGGIDPFCFDGISPVTMFETGVIIFSTATNWNCNGPYDNTAGIWDTFDSTGDPPSGICKRCGKPFIYVGDIPSGGWPKGMSPICECGNEDDEGKELADGLDIKAEIAKPKDEEDALRLYGWICPVCGRGNSPFVTECPCYPNFQTKIITKTDTKTEDEE